MVHLAIDTAQTACSVALVAGGDVVAERHIAMARGHAEHLVPLIGALCADAGAVKISGIYVDIGPGSFTGLRVGLAAARALGLAWDVPVLGYQATRLAAAQAFVLDAHLHSLWVMLDAGRGLVYAARALRDGRMGALENWDAPTAARQLAQGDVVVGNGMALVAPHLACTVDARDPTPAPASAVRYLVPEDFTTALQPLYVRSEMVPAS